MSLGQVHAILSAIAMAGPECRLLVFGCGNDSLLWASANASGTTVFVEDSRQWLETTRKRYPTLDIRHVNYPPPTVAESLPIDEARLRAAVMPAFMREQEWDIIIIDAPQGNTQKSPGRALPIYWSSLVARPHAQIFVDDYERDVERAHADKFLTVRRAWFATIPRQLQQGKPTKGQMLWSMGTGPKMPALPPRPERRGAVVIILDRSYLQPLKTFAHSLRNALDAGTHDVLILTNDDAVANDPFVLGMADRIEMFSDEDLERLKAVRWEAVEEHVRHPTLGKYTFLKFLAFNDFGYDHHILVDVDMVCLDPSFRFNDLVGDYDFASAPTMGSQFLKVAEDASPERTSGLIDNLDRKGASLARTINSGVLFIGPSLLNDATVSKLIAVGAEMALPLEQEITRQFALIEPGLRFRSLSPRYNFPEFAARRVGEELFKAKPPVFLHFNGRPKPWKPDAVDDWLTAIWAEAEAQRTRETGVEPTDA